MFKKIEAALFSSQ